MASRGWWSALSIQSRNLYYKLTVVFGLFFLIPVFGFFYFGIKYDIMKDEYVPFYFIVFLVFALGGHVILRNIFDRITAISSVSKKMVAELMEAQPDNQEADELYTIVKSFQTLESNFKEAFSQLGRKVSEISILKELSDLCYVTFDTEELIYVTLERALKLADADVGSILVLERPHKKTFVVKACIGLGEHVRTGERIDFETSVAKYAVINKSPLVIEDIERDSRFLRENRSHYGTKSFVCVPIKTIRDVIGVLTISRRGDKRVFRQEDLDILIPLLSNAAFTYENLRLLRESEEGSALFRTVERVFKLINSSFKDSELFQALLKEVRELVPFDGALILVLGNGVKNQVKVQDFLVDGQVGLSKGDSFFYHDSILEKVVEQGIPILVSHPDDLSSNLEKELFERYRYAESLLNPLKINGAVTGILALSFKQRDTSGSLESHKDIINWITDCIAFALERNRLFISVRRRMRELDTIKQIGSALASSTFDIDKVLKYTMDMIRLVINVEAGSLLLLNGHELEFKVAFNIDVYELQNFRLNLGQGIAGYVAARGEPLMVNDVKESPHFYGEVDELTGFSTRSALCVPMVSQGKVIGVIEVLNKMDDDFRQEDVHLLQSIASSVSIAIENARLYRETVFMAERERGIRQMFQKFVPEEIVEKIIYGSESDKSVIEELRTLTLLNIDIRGFSRLARNIGPQKTVSILNQFFSTMGEIVFKHKGIVDKYLGDGFLALFGAPVASAVDADNAVKAALEMKTALEEMNTYYAQTIYPSLNIQIGISIHTGEVIVGNIGFEKKMDYTVIGDAVNAVFRLQTLAKNYPNSIIVSNDTMRAARTRLDVRRIDELEIPADIEGIRIYELLGITLGG